MSDKNFKLINAPATPFYKRSTAEIAAKILPQDKTFPYGNVKRQAMASDDTTDGTSAFNDTLAGAVQGSKGEQRLPIIFPSGEGKYVMGDSNPLLYNDIQGVGATVEALAGAATVFNLGREPHDLYRYRKMSGIYIRGNAQASHGITFDDDDAGDELAGRWVLDSVFIEKCDHGIHKPKGNLGNQFRNVSVHDCNFGYFAVDSESPSIMTPGQDLFVGGEYSAHDLCAFYLSSDTEVSGATVLDSVIIEDNDAFGIYIDGYNLSYTMPEFRNLHFENNNRGAADVDIGQGQGLETPRDIFMRDVDYWKITGCRCTSTGWEFVNSMVDLDGCTFDALSVLIKDADSVVRCFNANLNGIDGSVDVIIESITQQRKSSGNDGITMVAQIPPRDNIVYSLPGTGVGVYSQTFAHRGVILSGTTLPAIRVESTGKGNGLYGWHNEYTLDVNDDDEFDELIALTANKWYVYTVSIMVASGEIDTLDFQNTDFFLVVNLDSPLRDNIPDGEWTTLGGITEYTDSSGSGNVRMRIGRKAGTNTVFNLGPCQVIQFDTQGEAVDYFNSKSFWQSKRDNDEWALATADITLVPGHKLNVTTATTLTCLFPVNLMVDDYFIIHCESASSGTVDIDPRDKSFKGAAATVTSSDIMTLAPGETVHLVAVSTSVMEVV